MKRILFFTLSALLIKSTLAFDSPSQSQEVQLQIEVSNLKVTKGTLMLAMFNSADGWPDGEGKAFKLITQKVSTAGAQVITLSVPPGTYAISMYHDENDNKKMDKNWVGYPTENFGFSNSVKVTIAAPKFAECSFVVSAAKKIFIKLQS